MPTEKRPANIDWPLLIFLVLFTNQAVISLKILGLVFIYILRPNLNFGFNKGKIPKFYIFIIILACINLLRIREFSAEYLAVFTIGCLFWLFAFLGFHQVRLSVDRNEPAVINNTLKAYTVLNLLACLYQLGQIMVITGRINPYTGLEFPYGMSTGDNIFGIPFQNSYYNMMIAAMLAVYFLYKKEITYCVISTLSLILVYGNVGTIIYFSVMFGILLIVLVKNLIEYPSFKNWLTNIIPPDRYHRYILPILLFAGVSYALLSPENYAYLQAKIESKVFAEKSNDESDMRTAIEDQRINPKVFDLYYTGDISKEEQIKRENTKTISSEVVLRGGGATTSTRKQAKQEITRLYIERLQGKVLSVLETKQFLLSSPGNLLFGAGPVRFSSATAQKVAGYDSSRLFMNIIPHYKSPLYEENHELIIATRKTSKSELFSNANWPDSFFNQIFGEYGILGFILFLAFYVWYFVKNIRYWSYSVWLFVMLIPFAHLTYLFEPLCVIVFFELLIMTDIKSGQLKEQAANAR